MVKGTKVNKMSVVADKIEQFILQKLVEEQEKMLVLQRNELADELDCAPSQISYVLSTRFSKRPGFIVESRRGLGGHIRIMQLPSPEVKVQEKTYTMPEVDEILHQGIQLKKITKREAQLLHEACQLFVNGMTEPIRSRAIHHLLERAKEMSRRKEQGQGVRHEKK